MPWPPCRRPTRWRPGPWSPMRRSAPVWRGSCGCVRSRREPADERRACLRRRLARLPAYRGDRAGARLVPGLVRRHRPATDDRLLVAAEGEHPTAIDVSAPGWAPQVAGRRREAGRMRDHDVLACRVEGRVVAAGADEERAVVEQPGVHAPRGAQRRVDLRVGGVGVTEAACRDLHQRSHGGRRRVAGWIATPPAISSSQRAMRSRRSATLRAAREERKSCRVTEQDTVGRPKPRAARRAV